MFRSIWMHIYGLDRYPYKVLKYPYMVSLAMFSICTY
jgi:hypothetical protein